MRPAARRLLVAAFLVAALALPAAAPAQDTPSPSTGLTVAGRKLQPAGRMTPVGAFPTGGALTPDGRFYWSVDAGRGSTAVRIVDLGTGAVKQALPIPGGYVGIAFARDGRHAYVSGVPADGDFGKGLKGAGGDVIHVFDVDPLSGDATEAAPIGLPNARDGAAAQDELPQASNVNAWPEGLDVSSDGKYLVVALGQADQVAIVDLATRKTTLANVGRYPYGVVVDPRRPRAYVTNERDGTVSAIEIPSGKTLGTIAVGGPRGAEYAHPQGIAADPLRDRVYVAVTDRDLVAVLDTNPVKLERYVDVSRAGAALGTAPVAPAVAPTGDTLYVATAGADSIVAIALERRPAAGARAHNVYHPRAVWKIKRFRKLAVQARRNLRKGRLAKRLRYLRRTWLLRTKKRACDGPTYKQDAAYRSAVLRAIKLREQALKRGQSRRKADRAFAARVASAQRKLPPLTRCAAPGSLPNAKPFSILGRVPTAGYPTDTEVTRDGKTLLWLPAQGLRPRANTRGAPLLP